MIGLYTRNIDSLSLREVEEVLMSCLPLPGNIEEKWENSQKRGRKGLLFLLKAE